LQHTAEKLINLYVNDNIGVGMNSMSMARGTLVHSASPKGAGMNQRATAGDTLPQAGLGKNKPLRGRWLGGWI